MQFTVSEVVPCLGASSSPAHRMGAIEALSCLLEGAGLEVLAVLDEPTAANHVLQLDNAAIVDVGGGTTGIAVIQNGDVVFTDDEATGGVHLSLVLAGNYKISYEEAEKVKTDKQRSQEILPIVRPVIEKIAENIKKRQCAICGRHIFFILCLLNHTFTVLEKFYCSKCSKQLYAS